MIGLEALYTVAFGGIESNTLRNGGVCILDTQKVYGGDSGYYYLGRYNVEGNTIHADIRIVKHDPAFVNVFGDDPSEFLIPFAGKLVDDGILGFMERKDKLGIRLPLRLFRRDVLP